MLLIVVMTGLCVIGTELSAKVQNVLILAQVAFLLVFVIVALYRVYAGTTSFDSVRPSAEWLNPFGAGGAALTSGLLLGVFIYWGWESAVNLTEEVEDSASAPGKAGVWSTVILLVTYLSVGFAVVAFAGTAYLAENAGEEEFIFALLAREVMGAGTGSCCSRSRRRRSPRRRPPSSPRRAPRSPWPGAVRSPLTSPGSAHGSAHRT